MSPITATAAGEEPAAVKLRTLEAGATAQILPPGARAVKPAPRAATMPALAYHDAGLAVIPLWRKSKRPLVRWSEYQTNPPNRDLVTAWTRRFWGCNWAVLLGPPSAGLIALDFDDAASYARWAAAWPDVAQAAPTVGTARGAHVYLVGPAGQRTASMENYAGEVKGAGGYVLLPPSVHPSGAVYRWLHGDVTRYVPDTDDLRQIGIVIPAPRPKRAGAAWQPNPDRKPRRLRSCVATILTGESLSAGERHNTALRLALHLRAEGWSEAAALKLLNDWWIGQEGEDVDRVRALNWAAELADMIGWAYGAEQPAHNCDYPVLARVCNPACHLAQLRSLT